MHAAQFPAAAQTADNVTASLREVRIEGQKHLSEAQAVAITGLSVGSQVGRADLQAAADKLTQTGLFDKVSYRFETRTGVVVTYNVEESPRVPAYFDNLPWFDGTLPEGGGAVDQAAGAIKELIASHGLQVALQHEVTGSPNGDGKIQ